MKICTIGLGYIGLPTSIMFAKHGVEVVGVDVKKSVIDSLNGGQIHIEEPGLQEALEEVIEKGTFKASLTPEKAERVLPGQILHELIHNNRIVGGITPACTEAGSKVYATFVQGEIIKTNAKTAEMSKLMENTFRDVNIALANELAKVCTELEINTLDVIEMANKHPRVNLHTPGPGVGGHCLAVDPYFIVAKAPETAKLINLSRGINVSMPDFVVENVNKLMVNRNGKVITVFGLTYKGNVDDIRESPAMEIYEKLKNQGNFEVRAYDPHVQLDWVQSSMQEAVNCSDLILILADHNEFKEFTDSELKEMNEKLIFDTKNVVKAVSTNIEYVNYGNLFEALKKVAVTK